MGKKTTHTHTHTQRVTPVPNKQNKFFSDCSVRTHLEQALGRDIFLQSTEILHQGGRFVPHQGSNAEHLELSALARIPVKRFENVCYISDRSRAGWAMENGRGTAVSLRRLLTAAEWSKFLAMTISGTSNACVRAVRCFSYSCP